MEAKAIAKYVRIAPRKVRIVIDLIRGKNVVEALAVLKNTPKVASDVIYKVRTFEEFQFIHPKDRATAELFPPQNSPPARTATHWLGWSVVGLIPAGLGTLITAPLAVIAAIKLLSQPAELIDHRRAWIVIGGAIVLWLIALGFIFILALHLV